jgi:hypothetical protein
VVNTTKIKLHTDDRFVKHRASNKTWGADEIVSSVYKAWYKFVKLHLLQLSKQNNNVSY